MLFTASFRFAPLLALALLASCERGGGGTVTPEPPKVSRLEAPAEVVAEPGEPQKVVVIARNASGDPVEGASISATVQGGKLSFTTSRTNTAGQGSFDWTLPEDGVGTLSLKAGEATAQVTGRGVYSAPKIDSVRNLTPGGTATLFGKSLEKLAATVLIDGKEARVASKSATVAQVEVPDLGRKCETHGRRVGIVAGEKSYSRDSARVELPNVLQMEPGDSRVLNVAALSCLPLVGDATYLLSVVNMDREWRSTRLFDFRSWTDSAATPGSPEIKVNEGTWRELPPVERTVPGGYGYSSNPDVFDSNYRTASLVVGDTLRFINEKNIGSGSSGLCFLRSGFNGPDTVSSVVAAVAPRHVITVDLGTPNMERFFTPAAQDSLARVAQIVGQWTEPTMRAVFDREFTTLRGGAGRTFTRVREMPRAGGAPDITQATPQVACPESSEIMVAYYWPGSGEDFRARDIAGIVIHEMGHLADHISGWRGSGRLASYWTTEAFADLAAETAFRLASGQLTQARVDQATVATPFKVLHSGPQPFSAGYCLWWAGCGTYQNGDYHIGSRMLRFARDLLGQYDPAAGGPLLYQRLAAQPDQWTVDGVAAQVGLSAEEFMDRFVLAEVSDDLLASGVAEAKGLPQNPSWKNLDPRGLNIGMCDVNTVPRANPCSFEGIVGAGSYGYWYIPQFQGKGVTLEFSNVNTSLPYKVRVTRLN